VHEGRRERSGRADNIVACACVAYGPDSELPLHGYYVSVTLQTCTKGTPRGTNKEATFPF
jgi:hypothetical protein